MESTNINTDIINSAIMHVNSENNTQVSVNFVTLPFDNDHVLSVPRYIDKCLPECLVLNLLTNNISLETIQNLITNMVFVLEIGNQLVNEIPLSLLWAIKSPQIIGHKLYIDLHFDVFFGNICLIGLNNNDNVKIKIYNNSLMNYVSNYELICKIKLYSAINNIRSHNIDMSDNIIQDVSILTHNIDDNLDVQMNFNIDTSNYFTGKIKGFFIESDNIVNQLVDLKFLINDTINRHYNQFLIRTNTVHINNNLIYIAFNPEKNYSERNYNSFTGAIHVNTNTNTSLRLCFGLPRRKINIYTLKKKLYVRYNNNNNNNNNNNINHSITNFGHTSSGHNYIDPSYNYIINDLPQGQIIIRPINIDRTTCNITHEQIEITHRYMTCSSCSNNFKEASLKQWLRQRSGNLRTCPTCRNVWTNYNIYVNSISNTIYG